MPIRSVPKRQTPARSYRPPSVTFAGWLVLLQGLGFLVAGGMRLFVLRLGDQGWSFLTSLAQQDESNLLFSAVLWTSLGLLALVSALALWGLRSWAWVTGMTLQVMSLAATLVAYLRHSPNYVAMLF